MRHVASCVCHGYPQKNICRYHAHPFTDLECKALTHTFPQDCFDCGGRGRYCPSQPDKCDGCEDCDRCGGNGIEPNKKADAGTPAQEREE